MSWGAVAGAAVSVVGGYIASKKSKGGASASGGAYDPYGPYRDAAAQKLNALMEDPRSLSALPEYQARQQAAARLMASQGYTGSGNALVAAANAGGDAYQQAFSNLSTLAGAGQSPATAASAADAQANVQQQQSNQMWGQIGGLVGRGIDAWQSRGSGTMGGQVAIGTGAINANSYEPEPVQVGGTTF